MLLKPSSTSVAGGARTQILVFLVGTAAAVVLGWIVLLPMLLTSVIQNRTGFPAHIDYFYANPFTAEVRMRGVTLMNPAGFTERNCIEVRLFTAKADLFSLLGSQPILDFSTIDVGRLTLATNVSGTTNLDLISNRLAPDRPVQDGIRDLVLQATAMNAKDATILAAHMQAYREARDLLLAAVGRFLKQLQAELAIESVNSDVADSQAQAGNTISADAFPASKAA